MQIQPIINKITPYWRRFRAWYIRHRLQYPKPRFWMLCGVFIFGVWFYFCLPNPLFKAPYSTIVEDRNGNFLSARIAADNQWRFPLSDSVPTKFKESICCFEDEYFYYHLGINPVSMARAMKQNFSRGRVVSGGSTISMQVIRLSRGDQNRSIWNKLYEIILAVRLELRYSKAEIMNLYAAHAPFGGNVVGLEAASWRYYNRPASMLSWGETATLAVLPNAPALVFPGKNHHLLLIKRNKLLDKMVSVGVIDSTVAELAKAEPLPDKPNPLPQTAQHLLSKAIVDGYAGQRIQTTLNEKTQLRVNTIAQKYGRYYSENFVNNIAVLVLDTRSGEILAYVGNIEILGKNTNQFVDNVVSLRSSGSILKPFLYAGMLNEGNILPNSLLPDVPTRIGGYAPKNFEKTYQGVVPADEALAHSLNIPAVRMLQEYQVDKLHHLLKKAGFTSINKPPDYYGLSLILGGAEVSLFETTSAYASMARSLLSFNNYGGKYQANDYRAASYLLSDEKDKKPDLVSSALLNAGAVYYTMNALAMVNRPWGEIGWEYFASSHKIAWKTGTSFGFRDAWAVGVTPQYTVGVWVGNSTGEGRPELTGVSYASPVMFEIFKQLNPTEWFKVPTKDLTTVSVCKQSGYRSTDNCPAENRLVPKSGIKVKACLYHQSVFLDSTETYRVTGACYPPSSMHIRSWFVLPPTQEYFYKRNNPEYMMLPPYMDGCAPPKEQVLDIIEPDNNSAIYIPKGMDGEEGMLIFDAVHRNPNATLFWHIDGEFIAQTHAPHSIEVTPTIGKHKVVIVDEAGNSAVRYFKILGK